MSEENKGVTPENGGGAAPAPQENVPATPAVNGAPSEPIVPRSEKDVSDLRAQIDNLNTALKSERETSKTKMSEMTKKLEESVSILDKFKGVFNPEQPVAPVPPVYASPDDINQLVDKKFQSMKEEQLQNQKIDEYKKEIKSLETEWDGKEGKPKYNDEEVLNWQRDNDKTYLSPKDAFLQMKHNELLDYEVKKRLSTAKPVTAVETPSSMAGSHEAGKPGSNAELDTRDAIRQAMEEAEKEM
jgi:hypothetical protein